jgi:thiol-disulfide isomerase/thioredoxin
VRLRVLACSLALLLLPACLARRQDPAPAPTGSSTALPAIALDPCPGGEDLLAADAAGDDALPDLTLDCLGAGPDVRLRRLGRVPTVLNLWAAWCGPCRAEMPAYQEVYRAAKGRVRFLGVNTNDSPREARQTVQLTAVSYPSVVDPKGTLRKELGGVSALGVPTTLLLDADGLVVEVLAGEQSAAELRKALKERFGVEA